MKKSVIVITLASYLGTMSGCAATDQAGAPDAGKSGLQSGFLGALGGALAGYIASGGKTKGALEGAVVGAVVGYIVGYKVGERREREYKSAAQIYREKPVLAERSSATIPPRVTGVVPTVKSESDRPLKVINGGQNVRLGMRYQIEIPKYSSVKEVNVVEINTLTDPDGLTMKEKDLTRTMMRPCGGVDADILVTLPKNAKEGTYVHTAVVKIGGKRYPAQRNIQVVKVDGVMQFYAVN